MLTYSTTFPLSRRPAKYMGMNHPMKWQEIHLRFC
jgi:hypothetical protein